MPVKSKIRISDNPVFLKLLLIGIIICVVSETVFMQFVHYDSQYRLLDPKHYNVKVVSQEDYTRLSNPKNRTVKLSNGTSMTKGEIWDSRVLPKYKSVNDGEQYVLVTLRGTAPFVYYQWYPSVVPIVVICVFGLFFGIRRKRGKEQQDIEQLEEKGEHC